MMLRRGDIYGQYEVEGLLGEGGMAAVYRVRHVQLGSLHALKVLFVTRPGVVERLVREGRAQAQLRHPNVVSVTDIVDVGGHPGLVLEFVDGPRLREWLAHHPPTLVEALFVFRGILLGVGAAHRLGLVHRDLKPENVMLATASNEVIPKVADFGLVKPLQQCKSSTRTGTTMGTPAYMAPEQIRDSASVDQRADLFALGCILYELVSGIIAFEGSDAVAIYNRILHGSYVPVERVVPGVPAPVVQAIDGLLEKDPECRIPTCDALYDLLYATISFTPSLDPRQMQELLPEVRALPARSHPGAPQRVSGRTLMPPLEPLEPLVPPEPLDSAPRAPQPTRRSTARVAVVASVVSGAIGLATPLLLDGLQRPAQVEPAPSEVSVGAVDAPVHAEPGQSPSEPLRVEPASPPPSRSTRPRATAERPAPSAPAPTAAATEPPAPNPTTPSVRQTADDRSTPPQPSQAVAAASPTTEPLGAEAPPAEEAAADPVGRIEITGDAAAVWLERSGRRYASGPLPPGTYAVYATFGEGRPIRGGDIEVQSGETVVLRCSSFLFNCRARAPDAP